VYGALRAWKQVGARGATSVLRMVAKRIDSGLLLFLLRQVTLACSLYTYTLVCSVKIQSAIHLDRHSHMLLLLLRQVPVSNKNK
jgi:hypothetical protein